MTDPTTEIRIPVKLFVSKFPITLSEDELREIFAVYGEIESLVILKPKDNARSQGCGFVRFTSIGEASRAIHDLNGKHVIDSALGPLNVEYAAGEAERLNLPSTAEGTSVKLFVGGIPLAMTEEELRDFFAPYGQVSECHVLPQKTANPLIQTKAAFVRFTKRADGMAAIEALDKKMVFPGAERTMDVRLAEGKTAPDQKPGMVDDRYNGPGRQPYRSAAPAQSMGHPMQHQQHQPQLQQQRQPAYAQPMPAPVSRMPRTIGMWTEYYAPDGRPYYHNMTTGVTSWEPPVEFRVAGPPPPPAFQPSGMMPMGAAPQQSSGTDPKGPIGANLFVFHIPVEWTESDLYTQFGPFGNLLSYRIAREKETNRPKGFAFVSYDNPGSALAAIAGLNGMIVSNGKRLKVSIKKGEEGQAPAGAYAAPY